MRRTFAAKGVGAIKGRGMVGRRGKETPKELQISYLTHFSFFVFFSPFFLHLLLATETLDFTERGGGKSKWCLHKSTVWLNRTWLDENCYKSNIGNSVKEPLLPAAAKAFSAG